MNELIVTFKTVNAAPSFRVASEDDNMVAAFMYEFFALFPGVNLKTQKIKALHQCTPDIKASINTFVDQYKKEFPVLNGVAAFFNRLADQEWFYFIPFKILNAEENISLTNYITALNTPGEDFKRLQQQTNELFGDLMKDYTILAFGEDRKSIGEVDKSNRVCRFCNNTRLPLSFNNRAHAISEALGNKTLILLEECDGCNEHFSKTIEPDLIEYLSLFRTIYDIKGKGGKKHLIGKNFELKKTDKLTLKFESDDENTGPSLPMNIPLHSHQDIASQNIYKTLCKYFLSVIPAEYLQNFQETIQWINEDKEIKELPRIASILLYDKLSEQPELVTYIRKTTDKSFPYAVGEFHFTLFRYVFIIPGTSNDESQFLTDAEYGVFWDKFKHYNKLPGWKFENFSNNIKKPFSINIKFDFSSPQ